MKLMWFFCSRSVKNYIKKLMRTWVGKFLVIMLAVCVAIVTFSIVIMNLDEEFSDSIEIVTEQEYLENMGTLELIIGGIALAIIVVAVFIAYFTGSSMFKQADVNILFPSPMKPQGVLMFCLVRNMLVIVSVASLYLIGQIGNLINAGLSALDVVMIFVAWTFALVYLSIIGMLLFVTEARGGNIRKFVNGTAICLLILLAAAFGMYFSKTCTNPSNGAAVMETIKSFFNAPLTRYIPIWGWLKGLVMYTIEGNYIATALCGLGLIGLAALIIFVTGKIKSEFYEDAMKKSEETAELTRKMEESGNAFTVSTARKKDRSDKLLRDGLKKGAGANMFFFKTMYNRRRFSILGFITTAMMIYTVGAAIFAYALRFWIGFNQFALLGGIMCICVFVKSIFNSAIKDIQNESFVMVPESHRSKIFWSILGGTVGTAIDVLPGLVIAGIIMGAGALQIVSWIIFAVTVDFYSTNANAFIELSAPISVMKSIKSLFMVLFMYFGLVPDIIIFIITGSLEVLWLGVIIGSIVNAGVGMILWSIYPTFLNRGRR